MIDVQVENSEDLILTLNIYLFTTNSFMDVKTKTKSLKFN